MLYVYVYFPPVFTSRAITSSGYRDREDGKSHERKEERREEKKRKECPQKKTPSPPKVIPPQNKITPKHVKPPTPEEGIFQLEALIGEWRIDSNAVTL